MRICLLTQYFPPEAGAPQGRLAELGACLADLGWEVEALTALPNYPTGRVFPGYSPLRPTVEDVQGIRTVRVPLVPSQSGFAKRIASYLSFAASATAWGPALCHRPDVLFVESPPLFIGFAALALSAAWRAPFVFNVSDLWPESVVRMGVLEEGRATRAAERLELALYRRAAGVTAQSEEIAASIRARAPGAAVEVITNGVDPSRFGRHLADDAARDVLGREPGPVFLYAGLLGFAQGLDQVLDAAATLPPGVPGRFVIVGDGPERRRLLRRVEEERISRVRIVAAQARERVPALLAAADVAVVSLGMDIPGAVPSKTYEAMASSLPVLLVARGEAARRVEEAACGLCAAPGDLPAIRAAIERLASDPTLRARLGEAGRRAAETTYARSGIAKRLDAFLRARIGAA